MILRYFTVSFASVFAALLAFDASASTKVCEMAKTRFGLLERVIQTEPNEEGNIELDTDFDGDGTMDKLVWFRVGSASIIPPDPSNMTVTISSTGKSFTVEDQRVAVANYRGKYYVVTRSLESEKGPWKGTVYLVSAKGISQLCSVGGKGRGP